MKLIKTHSEEWNELKNSNLTEIMTQLMKQFPFKGYEKQDIIWTLFYASNDIGHDIRNSVHALKLETDEVKIANLLSQLFTQQNISNHIENILYSLNQKERFNEIYKKDQFYHYIHQYANTDMVVPEGYYFCFERYEKSGSTRRILVKSDVEITIGELFDSVHFGCLMNPPTTIRDKEEEIEEIMATTTVNLINRKVLKDLEIKEGLRVLSATEVLKMYLPKAKENLAV